jgi:ribosomal protein S27E
MASTPKPNYIVIPVECDDCHEKQTVHVAARTGFRQMGDQTIKCVRCGKDFNVFVPNKIIDGPFGANIKEAVAIVKDWVKNP